MTTNDQMFWASRDFWTAVERGAEIERRWPRDEHGDEIEIGPIYEAVLSEYRANEAAMSDALECLAAAPIDGLEDAIAFQKALAAILACDEERGWIFDIYCYTSGMEDHVLAPLGPSAAKAAAALERALAARATVPERSAA